MYRSEPLEKESSALYFLLISFAFFLNNGIGNFYLGYLHCNVIYTIQTLYGQNTIELFRKMLYDNYLERNTKY